MKMRLREYMQMKGVWPAEILNLGNHKVRRRGKYAVYSVLEMRKIIHEMMLQTERPSTNLDPPYSMRFSRRQEEK